LKRWGYRLGIGIWSMAISRRILLSHSEMVMGETAEVLAEHLQDHAGGADEYS
jgi:hypothetical protein